MTYRFPQAFRYNHVMIDLETLDTAPTAAIIAIGAVKFSLNTCTTSDEFYTAVSGQSCQDYGLTINAETVEWWAQQDEECRKVLWEKDRADLSVALLAFNKFLVGEDPLGRDDNLVLWGNGATFDNVILRHAYEKAGIPPAWPKKHDFCFRTIKRIFSIEYQEQGVKHNALDDARNQALWLCEIMRRLKENVE